MRRRNLVALVVLVVAAIAGFHLWLWLHRQPTRIKEVGELEVQVSTKLVPLAFTPSVVFPAEENKIYQDQALVRPYCLVEFTVPVQGTLQKCLPLEEYSYIMWRIGVDKDRDKEINIHPRHLVIDKGYRLQWDDHLYTAGEDIQYSLLDGKHVAVVKKERLGGAKFLLKYSNLYAVIEIPHYFPRKAAGNKYTERIIAKVYE